ncbi:MAG: hypothetical protein CVV41_21530 [Candidatus Riflebacteria bacterium HGW-Riflebacteria-1]|jgi:hypothetical protein|nr:MAG: hypothetical protein CVV41_21530 [Candidatus Riflebacteria bacterium HGW-Riflebacteria-1]
MKPLKCILLIVALFYVACFADASEIRVFRLNYADPNSVATTIKALFGGKVNAIPVPSLNAVAVSVSDNYEMEEIAKLAAVLDRRPATFRFTVQSDSQGNESSRFIGVQRGRGRAETTRSTTNSTSQRSVVAMEFAKASLTDEIVKIYSYPGWYGPEAVQITTSHGLKVSGHLSDDNRIIVQVWFAQGDQNASEVLLTEVEARAGEWFSLGGLDQSSSQSGYTGSLSRKGQIGHKKTGGQIDRRFMLRVDVIR